MRPYLAIIKDSFRAALASRVLYVLLFLITFLLLVIAPFHYQETLDWKINSEANIKNRVALFERLVERHDDEGEEVIKHIWDRLPVTLTEELTEFVSEYQEKADDEGSEANDSPDEDVDGEDEGEAPVEVDSDESSTEAEEGSDETDDEKANVEIRVGGGRSNRRGRDDAFFRELRLAETLANELNELIKSDDFYSPEVWEGRALDNEAQEFIDQGVENLNDEQTRRLNRLLVGQAVSPTIQSGAATSLDFYYTPFYQIEFLSTNQTHNQFKSMFASQIPYYFDKFVLSIGLIIAILVTANIIPETFEPGSLNLLLSKPIFRWALLVSKFIGGCAFVALCATYLFLGLWTWLGLGMGIWDRSILLSIPIYILVFAIYYSVSTFIGVWFRSPIVSVIMTALFWAFCFGIGSMYAWVNTYMHNSQLARPVAVGENAFAVDYAHAFVSWDESDSKWDSKIPPSDDPGQAVAANVIRVTGKLDQYPEPIFPSTLGPLVNPSTNQVLLGSIQFGDPNTMGRNSFTIVDLETKASRSVGNFPNGAADLLLDDLGPIVVESGGKFSRVDMSKSKSEVKPTAPPKGRGSRQSGPSMKGWFEEIGPDNTQPIRGHEYVDADVSRNEIAVLSKLSVFVYKRNAEGKYELDRQVPLDVELPESMSGQIVFGGDTIMVVLGNGQIITLNADTLKEEDLYQPETRVGFGDVVASADGRWFGVVYRNGQLWMLDTENSETMFRPSVRGQGGISGLTFDGEYLWVCDRTDRMTKYTLDTFRQEAQYTPPCGLMSTPFVFSYRYIIKPFYRICPKPGEFYKLVTYLSDSSDSKSNQEVDLRMSATERNPWSPLWSGLGFMTLMLVLSCLMFHYSDY